MILLAIAYGFALNYRKKGGSLWRVSVTKIESLSPEAGNTVLDNFTAEEQVRIGELSTQLNSILDAAKKRQQEKLAKAAP